MEQLINNAKKIGKNNLIYQIFHNPNIYFVKLFVSTLSIGVFIFILSYLYVNSGLHGIKVPSSMHSLIGIVIGLLLVFRTNTAYDRWWEGRKTLSSMSTSVSFFITKLNNSFNVNQENETEKKLQTNSIKLIKINLHGFLFNLKEYLQKTADSKIIHVSSSFHMEQTVFINNIMEILYNLKSCDLISDRDVSTLEGILKDLLEQSSICERIKNTPIPMSYTLHIRMSIFIYLATLPFGLFYDLGVWATPIIMIIYYLIAGIEIISNEIENPFAGDPNDLPVDLLIGNILKSVK